MKVIAPAAAAMGAARISGPEKTTCWIPLTPRLPPGHRFRRPPFRVFCRLQLLWHVVPCPQVARPGTALPARSPEVELARARDVACSYG
jgi:hypothetical protein